MDSTAVYININTARNNGEAVDKSVVNLMWQICTY